MSESLFAKLSLIIHGRLVCESSSPILALCLCDHTRINKPETKLHRLTLSSFPIFTQKIITCSSVVLVIAFSK
ncbi:hypothetical protein CC786_13375 [Salmonella enterica subsp. enterica serovar Tennessee]|uniref:Uncharacterized protein n=1 Tax=Salmonella enterica subsp. enterica serovar Tennessee TaxID=143221 RepID=A0A5U6G617_SALET|nr:hypothetical protein [Salmonella enterica subsp. enterica serovar Tennessee]EAM6751985.1 hypothetical protein [Salmonella enterica]EAA5623791.1 hypothetical protein [Salmonella enterica subsp. enterica serovar Tennessee]EAV4373970.1 hypothetical protein [Salmonella enterica]EBC1856087.1 hypothetical protein [Salmonella enterica subsp. enterica serovar Tennessee]